MKPSLIDLSHTVEHGMVTYKGYPDLIQRPIVVRGRQAVLARPPENVEKLL